jgi:hypothetical protein
MNIVFLAVTSVTSELGHFMTNSRVKWNFVNHPWSMALDALPHLQHLGHIKCYSRWIRRRRNNISLIYHKCFPPLWDQSMVRAVVVTLKCSPSVNFLSFHKLCPSYRTQDPYNSLVATVYRWTSHIKCITVSLKLIRQRQYKKFTLSCPFLTAAVVAGCPGSFRLSVG